MKLLRDELNKFVSVSNTIMFRRSKICTNLFPIKNLVNFINQDYQKNSFAIGHKIKSKLIISIEPYYVII